MVVVVVSRGGGGGSVESLVHTVCNRPYKYMITDPLVGAIKSLETGMANMYQGKANGYVS